MNSPTESGHEGAICVVMRLRSLLYIAKKKRLRVIRNRLIINVGPEGYDPTTFGL